MPDDDDLDFDTGDDAANGSDVFDDVLAELDQLRAYGIDNDQAAALLIVAEKLERLIHAVYASASG